MSILYNWKSGWLISHEKFVNSLYSCIGHEEELSTCKINSNLFQILQPFKRGSTKHNLKRKANNTNDSKEIFNNLRKTIEYVHNLYQTVQAEIEEQLHSITDINKNSQMSNDCAIELSKKVYNESGKACITNALGENSANATYVTINDHNFIFPAKCRFYCKNVSEISQFLNDEQYNLIVLDPPWWNKYVRRKKAKTDHGYLMMYNDELKAIPIENLLHDNGLVIVWCTNSLQHLQALQNDIFPKWNVQFVAKWYWLKITKFGEPICGFSEPPGKQPFEQILIGIRNPQRLTKPEDGKLIISIPSALHSHKPPLIEILQSYLPENPKCLELFARYLLPNWTSWGLEAVRFQHESLYECISK